MRYIFATHNRGKVEQVEKILRQLLKLDIKIETSNDVGYTDEIVEGGESFEANSDLKANTLYNYCKSKMKEDFFVFADDAGMCVDALNGAPGVYSDRYAGEHVGQEENLTKLFKELEDKKTKEERSAQFVSVFTGYLSDGTKFVSRGECKGYIATERGKKPDKLTYGPVFVPNGFDKTLSDFTDEEFAKLEQTHHRVLAFEGLIKEYQKYLDDREIR